MFDLEHYKNQVNGSTNSWKASAKNRNSMLMETPSRKERAPSRDTITSARSLQQAPGLASNRSSYQPNQLSIDMNDSIFKESPEKDMMQVDVAKPADLLHTKLIQEKDALISELTEKYNFAE